jgi:hypothetical protein
MKVVASPTAKPSDRVKARLRVACRRAADVADQQRDHGHVARADAGDDAALERRGRKGDERALGENGGINFHT